MVLAASHNGTLQLSLHDCLINLLGCLNQPAHTVPGFREGTQVELSNVSCLLQRPPMFYRQLSKQSRVKPPQNKLLGFRSLSVLLSADFGNWPHIGPGKQNSCTRLHASAGPKLQVLSNKTAWTLLERSSQHTDTACIATLRSTMEGVSSMPGIVRCSGFGPTFLLLLHDPES